MKNKILGIRKNPNLAALNDGDYKMLPQLNTETSLLRENEKGSVVISVANPSQTDLTIPNIRLSWDDNSNPAKHLKNGDIMTDLNGVRYEVKRYGGWYVERTDGKPVTVTNDDTVLYLYKSTNDKLNSSSAINTYSNVS